MQIIFLAIWMLFFLGSNTVTKRIEFKGCNMLLGCTNGAQYNVHCRTKISFELEIKRSDLQ